MSYMHLPRYLARLPSWPVSPARGHSDQWLAGLLRLQALCQRWRKNARTRRQLAQLDPRLLGDAGIGFAERQAELDKPCWRD